MTTELISPKIRIVYILVTLALFLTQYPVLNFGVNLGLPGLLFAITFPFIKFYKIWDLAFIFGIVFLLIATFSTIQNPTDYGILVLLQYFFVFIVVFPILISYFSLLATSSLAQRKFILRLFFISFCISHVFSIIWSLELIDVLFGIELSKTNNRYHAFVGNPNGYALISVYMLFAAYFVRKIIGDFFFLIYFMLTLFGIWHAQSNGGFLLSILLFVLLVFQPRQKSNLLNLCLRTFLLSLPVIFYLFSDAIIYYYELIIEGTRIGRAHSADTRFNMIFEAWSLIKEAPFFGYGIGASPIITSDNMNIHNTIL